MRSHSSSFARASALFLTFALGACSCETSDIGKPCTTEVDCNGAEVCTGGHCAHPPPDGTVTDGTMIDAQTPAGVVGIVLSPDPATLTVDLGSPSSSLVFTVEGTLSGGGTVPLTNATFSTDNRAPGSVDGTGRFFANGVAGGTIVVTASAPNPAGGAALTDTVTLNVVLTSTTGAGTGAGSPGVVFMNTPVTSAADDAEILYPLHQAVMPQNVQPADVQWACDGNGTVCPEADFFRVTLTKPNITVTQYISNPSVNPNDHFLVGAAAWRALAQTDPNSDVTIRVDRWQAAMSRVVSGTAITMRFAAVAITGRVYYWDIDSQTIQYIEDGTSVSNNLLPHSDSPENGGGGDGCVGCHSVSPSGRYMLANTNFANYGALFDLTRADLSTANPTPTEWPGSLNTRWRMSTWSPDETRAMVSTAGGTDGLNLIDPATGATVQAKNASNGNLTLPSPATMPAWARDNTTIAYIAGNNNWAGETTTGNLSLLPVVNSAMDQFGTTTSLLLSSVLDGAPEIGATTPHGIFYPTWSPDSAWIAFASGTSSRSDPRDSGGGWVAGNFAHTSSLYLLRRNGTGRQRLVRGCAASTPEKQNSGVVGTAGRAGLDFQPNFSPFQGGGYYWLSFLSRRPYGNTLSGNRGTAIQPGGIWIMAIRMDADGNSDPSEVAFWLPGQNPTHRAISAFWAPRPCRAVGTDCSVGSECCGGDCRPPQGGGQSVCSPPDTSSCRMQGETCSSVGDCCGSANDPQIRCTGNVCTFVIEG